MVSVPGALHYYDLRGRTWERQAYIKARVAAGDRALGEEFLETLRPWIYRRYLSRADISGIRALKRASRSGRARRGHTRDVKTGHGGIRDIEFVIQFLQLLNGGDLPALLTGNTLKAISQLKNCGCLIHQERSILQENYRFLRKVEHRLQILFDLQTHLLPSDAGELRKLAVRMGYADSPERTAPRGLRGRLPQRDRPEPPASRPPASRGVQRRRRRGGGRPRARPRPAEQKVVEVFGKYRFRDVKQAFRNLMSLGEEKIRFLSTRRCRHFLASIAPRLLKAIAATPDPDFTLVHLNKVSDSLGGKGVLWELFIFNPPSLRLYVEVCAHSATCPGITHKQPGNDRRADGQPGPGKAPVARNASPHVGGAAARRKTSNPILHSFRNWPATLRGGARHPRKRGRLGHDRGRIRHRRRLPGADRRKGVQNSPPSSASRPSAKARAGQTCSMVVLALGKFGGREMNYHSDLDIVFLYEADGIPRPPSPRAVPGNL